MASARLPDELKFLANSAAPSRRPRRLDGGQGLRGHGLDLGGGARGRPAARPRRARASSWSAANRAKAEAVREELGAAVRRRVDIVIADFRDLAAVRAAAEMLLRQLPAHRRAHQLGRAALHRRAPSPPGGLETVFCVNHLAPFLLTHLLLERMKESAPARIIQVNSEGHRFGGFDLDDLDWERRRYTRPAGLRRIQDGAAADHVGVRRPAARARA